MVIMLNDSSSASGYASTELQGGALRLPLSKVNIFSGQQLRINVVLYEMRYCISA